MPTLPEGAIVNAEIRVWQYIDDEGHMRFVVWWDGMETPLSQLLGLLDLAKYDLMKRSGLFGAVDE